MLKIKKIIFKFIYPPVNSLTQKLFGRVIDEKIFGQIIKHYAVSFFCSLLNYFLFVFLKNYGLGTRSANTITCSVVIVVTFSMQKFFTYKPDNHSMRQPLLFLALAFVMYVLETLILVSVIDGLTVPAKWGKLFSILVLAPLSFIMQKYIVFKNKDRGI